MHYREDAYEIPKVSHFYRKCILGKCGMVVDTAIVDMVTPKELQLLFNNLFARSRHPFAFSSRCHAPETRELLCNQPHVQ